MKRATQKQVFSIDLQQEYQRLVRLQSKQLFARKELEEDYALTCGTCSADYEIYSRAETGADSKTFAQIKRQYIQKVAAAQVRYEDAFSRIEKHYYDQLFLHISTSDDKYYAILMARREAINEARRKYALNKRQLIEGRNIHIAQAQTKYHEILSIRSFVDFNAQVPVNTAKPIEFDLHTCLLDEEQAHVHYAGACKIEMDLYVEDVKRAESELRELVLDLAVNRVKIDAQRPNGRSAIDGVTCKSFPSKDQPYLSSECSPLHLSSTSAFDLFKKRRVSLDDTGKVDKVICGSSCL